MLNALPFLEDSLSACFSTISVSWGAGGWGEGRQVLCALGKHSIGILHSGIQEVCGSNNSIAYTLLVSMLNVFEATHTCQLSWNFWDSHRN